MRKLSADAKPVESQWAPPSAASRPDEAALVEITRKLSGALRDFPGVQSSRLIAQHWLVRRRSLTSDGTYLYSVGDFIGGEGSEDLVLRDRRTGSR